MTERADSRGERDQHLLERVRRKLKEQQTSQTCPGLDQPVPDRSICKYPQGNPHYP